MEQNPVNPIAAPAQPASPVQAQPQPTAQTPTPTPAPVSNAVQKPPAGGKKWLKIVFLLLVLVIFAVIGFFAYNYYFAQNNQTYNANVYKSPQTKITTTPTPTGYQNNPSDTTDQGIDNDSSQANQNITTLNSDLNNVDQSVNDQQTNLQ